MELGQLVVAPLDPRHHTHTLIFLHGRGDTSASMTDALLRWSRNSRRRSLVDVFPTVRWVFPQAEQRLVQSSHDDTTWPQWFDIWNVLDMSDGEDLQAPGLRDSVASVRRIVRNEARKVGGLDRVLLSGISQGGATAVHALLHLGAVAAEDAPPEKLAEPRVVVDLDEPPPPARLCGLLCFSCWLPFPGGTLEETREVIGLDGEDDDPVREKNDEIVRHTPAFLGHCADDPVVFPEYGRLLRDELRGFGMEVEWNEYPDGGHWLNSPQGVDDVVDFLKARGIPAAMEEDE
ncbi:alpha/beta-hydrolase [Hypoxylon rubiginosum]|uniref:Alpha/beta-hydrolase n=1 Tax=Hypoxylon rubiginosum TaxID=110542 RepID=A0ACB9YQK3_9PEZI|nr:alpha/beta-hydrolase [Hypoxylon rubiginosum]